MRRRIDVAEGIRRDPGVDLRRRDTGMTEQLLHDPYIRSPLQQVSRERMPQAVRRDAMTV